MVQVAAAGDVAPARWWQMLHEHIGLVHAQHLDQSPMERPPLPSPIITIVRSSGRVNRTTTPGNQGCGMNKVLGCGYERGCGLRSGPWIWVDSRSWSLSSSA